MRGQTSFEYVILVGTIMVLVIPTFYYVTYQSSLSLKVNEADDAVKSIARTADTIYALGPGAKNYVWVTIPPAVVSTSVGNNEILIVLRVYGGQSDVYAATRGNVSGVIPTAAGTFKIPVEMLDTGVVQIG